MALVSPGVEVTIIDESQYTSAGQNTVPYILIATAEDKLNPAGSGIAPGTQESAVDNIYLITSQRELVNTFGNPTFYKTSGGNALHGYELNEYGLMAAYSVLGATNRAYIQRVDVDMSELEASLVRPKGDPNNGAYWFDLTESAYGFFVWNSTQNTFTVTDPILITDDSETVTPGGVPLASIGAINSYAIVTTNLNNPVYWKNPKNAWVQIGTTAWMGSIPTVISTISDPVLTVAGDLYIDGTQVTLTVGTTIEDVNGYILSAGISGVTSDVVNGRLEIYSTNATLLIAVGVDTGVLLTEIGLTAGTFNTPVLTHATHTNVPRWRDTDTTPRPSGSVWQK